MNPSSEENVPPRRNIDPPTPLLSNRQNAGDCFNSAKAAINAVTVAALRSIQQVQATAAQAIMQASIVLQLKARCITESQNPKPSPETGLIFLTPAQAALLIIASILSSILPTLAITYLILKPRMKAAQTQQLLQASLTSGPFHTEQRDIGDKNLGLTRSKSKPLTSSPILPQRSAFNASISGIRDVQTGAITPDSFS